MNQRSDQLQTLGRDDRNRHLTVTDRAVPRSFHNSWAYPEELGHWVVFRMADAMEAMERSGSVVVGVNGSGVGVAFMASAFVAYTFEATPIGSVVCDTYLARRARR